MRGVKEHSGPRLKEIILKWIRYKGMDGIRPAQVREQS